VKSTVPAALALDILLAASIPSRLELTGDSGKLLTFQTAPIGDMSIELPGSSIRRRALDAILEIDKLANEVDITHHATLCNCAVTMRLVVTSRPAARAFLRFLKEEGIVDRPMKRYLESYCILVLEVCTNALRR
jgi:hypothetical protein